MTQFLSDEWFVEMADAADNNSIEAPGRVSLREIVADSPFGSVAYVLNITDGIVTFSRDDEVADVTFSQSYDTAVALHKGELTIHDAFFTGQVRVSGHLNTLLEHSDLLKGLSPAFDTVRATTTY